MSEAELLAEIDAYLAEAETKSADDRILQEGDPIVSSVPVELGDPYPHISVLDGNLVEEAKGLTEWPKVTRYLEVSGPPGASVEMFALRYENTGGHIHGGRTQDPRAVGVLTPRTFVLGGGYPQRTPVAWSLPQVSGSIIIFTRFSIGQNHVGIADLLYTAGLVTLIETQTLKLKSPDPAHPSPYWVTPQMKVALEDVAQEFYLATNIKTTITDGSLQFGGVFDINKNWQPPHIEHRDGQTVDARIWPHTEEQKKIFERLCSQRGLRADRHSNPAHWHIRFP